MIGLNGLGQPNLYSVWRRRNDGATREVVGTERQGGGGRFVHTAHPAPSMFERHPYLGSDWCERRSERRHERVPMGQFLDLHEPFPDSKAEDLARKTANAGIQLTLAHWHAKRRRRRCHRRPGTVMS